ncbi:MAG: ABC transporter permease [Planctomycetota bacterium]
MRAIRSFFLRPYTSAWRHRQLLRELSRREIHTAFNGSMLGVAWLVLQPLLSLAVYAAVFGGILNIAGGTADMAFVSQLFTGMIVYQAFADSVGRASQLVLARPNYVTKVAFPLHLLPWPVMLQTALNAAISTALLALLHLLFVGVPAWTVVLVPVALLPVLLLGLGVSWVLASLAVYVRDVQDVTRVVLQLMFFLSPIVWSVDKIQNESMRTLVLLNPLAVAMESSRALIAGSAGPGAIWVGGLVVLTVLATSLGHAFFRRVEDGFADVL